MKLNSKLLSAILILSLVIPGSLTIKEIRVPLPSSETIIVNEKAENYKKRREWIEDMHYAAPGFNWRKSDQIYRNKRQSVQANRQSIIPGSWREIGSKNQAGRVHLAEHDTIDNIIYCASSGGNIWKSDPSGSNWMSLNDGFRIPDIRMIRLLRIQGQKRLLIASGQYNVKGFYYSDNEGQNWSISGGLDHIEYWGYIKRAFMLNDAQHSIYLLANEWDNASWTSRTAVYYSNNHGQHFARIDSFSQSLYGNASRFDIWASRYDTVQRLLIIANDSIFEYDSLHNRNFISHTGITNNNSLYLTAKRMDQYLQLYIGNAYSSQTDIYASDSLGGNFTLKNTIPQTPFMVNSFHCSEKNPQNIYFGGVECYRSYDKGSNWVKLNNWSDYYASPHNRLHADICGINSFLDAHGNEYVYINTDGGIYYSDDSLKHVNNLSLSGLLISQYYSTYTCRFAPQYSHAGSQDQGYQMSSTMPGGGQIDFDQVISGDYGHIVSGDNGSSIWMVYPGFAAYYPDINTHQNSFWWTFTGSNFHWMPPLMPDPYYPNIVYLGGGNNSQGARLFMLTYQSSSVTAIEENFDFSEGDYYTKISAMAYDPLNPANRYVANSKGGLFTSADGGLSWSKSAGFGGPEPNYLYGSVIKASAKIPGRIYVAGSGYSNPPIYRSDDYGQTFTDISNGLPNTLIYDIAFTENESHIFAATEVGPFVCSTADFYWTDMRDNQAPDQVYWAVDFIPALHTARFATYGRGIWDFVIDSVFLGNNNSLSSLHTPVLFPNPARDYFYLELKEHSKMPIKIYLRNTQGSLFTLNILNPGSGLHKINCKGLPAGMYVVEIKRNGEKFSCKLMIL